MKMVTEFMVSLAIWLFSAAWWYPLKRRMSYDAQTDKYWDIPAEFRGSKEDWIFVPNK